MGIKEKILKESKSLEEVIFEGEFLVKEVLCKSYAIEMTPVSEMVIGGRPPRYNTGYATKLILKVESVGKDKLNVKELHFEGVSAVKAGDSISALMPIYREEQKLVTPQHVYDDRYRSVYFLRDLKDQEKAIELNILAGKEILRTDRAVDYSFFRKSD